MDELSRLFWWPGMKLMRMLSVKGKLCLMALSASLPFGWIAFQAGGLSQQAAQCAAVFPMVASSWLLLMYLGACYVRTSFGAIRVLQGSVAQLASGDFASEIRLRASDEMLIVAQTLDGMTGHISQMVSDVRSNSSMVAQAGMTLTQDIGSLSQRTEMQAASLEQTSASVHDISEAVGKSAAGARAVDEMASQVRHIAEGGGQAVQEAVISVQDIQNSSRRVQEIVGVIEGLSFQTNLLALNAAVEAARAGEQGRGFAVVAAEVRALAQRSAEAAREIKQLISQSVEHVDRGVHQINGTRETFERIIQGIRDVAENTRVIAASASEQSQALTQVSQAVLHLDQLTQENGQMVEATLNASAELGERARRLSTAVASFKLRQGSADEALELVQRALAVYKTHGQRALAMITEQARDFVDRDMYVFAFDRDGYYRALSGKPEKVGTAVKDNPGVDGAKLVQDAFTQAARGGGWVDYVFTNPKTGSVDLKTSYVVPVSENMILGCGIYKSRELSNRLLLKGVQPGKLRKEQEEQLGLQSTARPGQQVVKLSKLPA
jgi:methyl-accepting chemotaxis protein